MDKTNYFALILCAFMPPCFAQVGIGTAYTDASSIFDVESTEKGGALAQRLTSTQRNEIVGPVNGLMIYDTSLEKFQFNCNTPASPTWNAMNSNSTIDSGTGNIISSGTNPEPYLASSTSIENFIISSISTQTIAGLFFERSQIRFVATQNVETITGLPFKTSQIGFMTHYNVKTNNLNSDNAIGNNNSGLANSHDCINSHSTNYGDSILQQVTYIRGSHNSINDISQYASCSYDAIGVSYPNQSGNSLGHTNISVTSFSADSLNMTNHSDNLSVIFEAHR